VAAGVAVLVAVRVHGTPLQSLITCMVPAGVEPRLEDFSKPFLDQKMYRLMSTVEHGINLEMFGRVPVMGISSWAFQRVNKLETNDLCTSPIYTQIQMKHGVIH
jgi:hypothetical protein